MQCLALQESSQQQHKQQILDYQNIFQYDDIDDIAEQGILLFRTIENIYNPIV